MLSARVFSANWRVIQRSNRVSLCTIGVFNDGEQAREREFIRKEEQKAFEQLRERKRQRFADELKMIVDKNPTPIINTVFDLLLDWKVETTIEGGVKGVPCFQHDQDRGLNA